MKTSIMDKIRILRSRHKKGNLKKGKPPSPVVDPLSPSQSPTVSETPQQWVPVLVLDISQAKSTPVATGIPVVTSMPVTASNSVTRGVTAKKAIIIKKGSIKSGTKGRPSHRNNVPQSQPVAISAPETVDYPLALPVPESTGILNVPEKMFNLPERINIIEMAEETNKESLVNTEVLEETNKKSDSSCTKPVNCVFCDKTFPSLEDMQAHYLSTHKTRRSRDGRKRKPTVENLGTQSQANQKVAPSGSEQEAEESLFPVTDKSEIDPKCPVCSIAFRTTDEVKNHIKEVHSYTCSECSSTFYSLFHFTNHKCSKGTKKVRRGRKKVNNNTTMKPEVVKVMNSFVKIQPKTKKKGKASSTNTQKQTSPPPLKRIQGSPPLVSPGVENDDVKPLILDSLSVPEVQTNFVLSPAGGEAAAGVEEAAALPPQETESVDQKTLEEDSYCLPSITTTYTLKLQPNSTENKTESANIQVIETSNIHQARQLIRESKPVDSNVSKSEVIMEKIAQLKNNPNVSISWMPTLKLKKQDDGEFVCGRCNVICDDMEDYMDHIQDCLNMTSVTLQPTSNPPRRFLRLQYESSSFGFWETNNNRYSVNQNLINKLKAVLPQSEYHGTKPAAAENAWVAPVNSTAQTFRDLLDDDFGYESYESIDMHTGGSASPMSPVTKQGDSSVVASAVKSPKGNQIPVLQNQAGVTQNKVFVSSAKAVQPMVVIPFESKAKFNLNVISDQLSKNPGKCEIAESVGESLPPHGDLSCQPFTACGSPSMVASPLDMLLDQDEIKMEVEEEVVEDHYEICWC